MKKKENSGFKKVLMIYGGILLILVISCTIVYAVYTNKLKESAKQSLIASERIADLVPNTEELLQETTSEISKTINEIIGESANEVIENNIEVETDVEPEEIITEEIIEPEPVKKLEFMYPVEGEIIKGFEIDNLVFSETLQEWIVHKGIDIKAERAAIVKASEEGQVIAIKNDPRYGLTVIIEHREGYKTMYSNLLTTEFVEEGETVAKGQSLGTVGNSAAFEIADEPHLHFEMLKDDAAIDPLKELK